MSSTTFKISLNEIFQLNKNKPDIQVYFMIDFTITAYPTEKM